MIARVVGGAIEILLGRAVILAFAALQGVMTVVIVALYLATRQPPTPGQALGTGDFLAFWTGASLVHDGRGGSLYDFAVQKQLQTDLLGPTLDLFQPYLNPPLLALALAPAVPLGYLPSFFLFGVTSMLAFAAAMALWVAEVGHLGARPADRAALVALIAGYPPIARMMFGGQNTVITLSLMAGLYVGVRRGWWPLAAVMLGLLTYKPQFAIGCGLALLALGQWRATAGGVAIGLAHAALGAWVCGPRWPLQMLEAMGQHAPLERAENGHTHFSWMMATAYAFPQGFAAVIGAVGVLGALGAIVGFGWACRTGRVAPPVYWAVAISGTMFASPHLQYYDAGLLALPVVLLVDHAVAREGGVSLATRGLLALGYLGYGAHEYAEPLGFQPLAVMLAAVLGWALYVAAGSLPRGLPALAGPHGG